MVQIIPPNEFTCNKDMKLLQSKGNSVNWDMPSTNGLNGSLHDHNNNNFIMLMVIR